MRATPPTTETWRQILAAAYALFDDLERKGFPKPPFSLGGGTVLMLRFEHRLSKDIDFFGYDAQWLSLLSPRLNDTAAAMATSYVEQANGVKILMSNGDIDFVIAGDVAVPVVRETLLLESREMLVDPTSEVLAKKLFHRAAAFKSRDLYDLSTAIELDPKAAKRAVHAAASKRDLLLRRFDELGTWDQRTLLEGLVPYEGKLPYADRMVEKVRAFVVGELGAPSRRG